MTNCWTRDKTQRPNWDELKIMLETVQNQEQSENDDSEDDG